MAFSAYHNISSNVTQQIMDAGDKLRVKSILIANTHATHGTHVDLFINDSTNTYYFLKNHFLFKGGYIVLNNNHLAFDSSVSGYGLFLKLTGAGTSTGAVDVMMRV